MSLASPKWKSHTREHVGHIVTHVLHTLLHILLHVHHVLVHVLLHLMHVHLELLLRLLNLKLKLCKQLALARVQTSNWFHVNSTISIHVRHHIAIAHEQTADSIW